MSLSVSCGYLAFRGSQGKHSVGKTEPPSLVQTEKSLLCTANRNQVNRWAHLGWALRAARGNANPEVPGECSSPCSIHGERLPVHGWPKASFRGGLPAWGRLATGSWVPYKWAGFEPYKWAGFVPYKWAVWMCPKKWAGFLPYKWAGFFALRNDLWELCMAVAANWLHGGSVWAVWISSFHQEHILGVFKLSPVF